MESNTSQSGVTTRAVLVGIDHYQRPLTKWPPRVDIDGKDISFQNLQGCVNDILAMRQYLIKTMKVDPSHIKTLLGPVPGSKSPFPLPAEGCQLPTYENITGALEDVARASVHGDVVYVHCSGHGACATSVFDKRGDDIDHCLVPYDIAHGGKYIRDLEFGALLQEIVEKGAVLTVVLDSCYSGGAVRASEDDDDEADDSDEGIRAVKGVYASNPAVDLPVGMDRILRWSQKPSWMESPDGFVVLAACLENQKAKEFTVRKSEDGGTYKQGHLTHWLLDTVQITPISLAGRTICDRVRAKVTAHTSEQTPYVVGDLDTFFFSKGMRSRVYTLPVQSVDLRSKLSKHWSLCLWGGVMDGVKTQSEYAILPLEFDPSRKFDQSDILARVKVTRLSSGECRAIFLEPEKMTDSQWSRLTPGCSAVLQKLPIDEKYKVRFKAASANEHAQFEEGWKRHVDDSSRLHLAQRDGKEDVSFEIRLDKYSNFQITDAGADFPPQIANSLELDPLSWNDKESIPRLVSRLEHLARFKLLKGLENPGIRANGVAEIVSVSVEPAARSFTIFGEWENDIHCEPTETIKREKDGSYHVRPARGFRIRITNNLNKPVGCVVLDFNQQLGITKVFPSRRIEFKTIEDKDSVYAEMALYLPERLEDAASAGLPIIEIFKVIVSIPERNFDAMQLPKLKDVDEDASRDGSTHDESSRGLDGLLQKLGPLAREGAAPVRDEDRTVDWQTVDVRVRLIT